MSAAAVPRLARKPPAMQGVGEARAHRKDVEKSRLKRTACQVYGALCDCLDHSRYTGLVWPKIDTLARRLHVTVRTIQRGLEELLSSGWIGTPCGDAGGAREGVLYHLHPGGTPCLFCLAADRTINQRRRKSMTDETGDILTPVRATGDKSSPRPTPTNQPALPATDDFLSPVTTATGVILAATGDKNAAAYKERRFLRNLSKSSTTMDEIPADFEEQMRQESGLDRGAVQRLWRTAHEILPDVSGDEIRHFFHLRAAQVYRNRRVQNPPGLMLSTISDWLDVRSVQDRRQEFQQAAEQMGKIRNELQDMGIASQAHSNSEKGATGSEKDSLPLASEIAQAAIRKALR